MVRHAPGAFSWSELQTSDVAAAKKFYESLFGWTIVDNRYGEGEADVYPMMHVGKKVVGGITPLQGEGVPPHWLSYVSVSSANRIAKKAKELGGTVITEPFDVMGMGRMAVIQDPQGATFALWQAKKHNGAQIKKKVGSLAWNELVSKDTKGAVAFYTKLFPWKAKTSKTDDGYTKFWLGRKAEGGLFAPTPEMGEIPPYWETYFAVANCKRATAKAQKLGATVLVGPKALPSVGTLSVLRDPQGASFALFTAAIKKKR